MAATLERRRIAGVRRVGKHIVFDLEHNGAARVRPRHKGSPAKIHDSTGEDACAYVGSGPMDRSSGHDRAYGGLRAAS